MKNKGIPKKDGSGKGQRLNMGRGGCEEPREIGKGKGQGFGRGQGKGRGRNK